MFYKAKYDDPNKYTYIIKKDDAVGYYLYVYSAGKCIKDHLQDTLKFAIEQAWEDYGVPEDSWVQA